MTVVFELNGQPFTALNGGPIFKFTEAVSFQISSAFAFSAAVIADTVRFHVSV